MQQRIIELLRAQETAGAVAPDTGIAVALVSDTAVLFTGCYGLRDRERALPVTADTEFPLCSSTKAFTAAAFLSAAEAQAIDLDAPINASRTLIPLADAATTQQVSIADILAHRTGLPANDLLWYFGGVRAKELSTALSQLPLIPDGFRSTFIYNNLLFAALGDAFAHIAGEPLAPFVQRQILNPLKMTATAYTPSVRDNAAAPYANTTRLAPANTAAVAAAGGMHSTIEDVSRWISCLLAGGTTATGDRVMSQAAVERMQQQMIGARDANPLFFQGLDWLEGEHGYGLGWFLSSTRGYKVLHHPGLIDGYTTLIVMIPEKKLGVIVLMNQNLSPVPGLIARELIDCALRTPASALAGRFTNPAFGPLEVVEREGGLRFEYREQSWPFSWKGDAAGEILVSAFGIQLPLPVQFELQAGTARSVTVPLSLDPRVPPNVFERAPE